MLVKYQQTCFSANFLDASISLETEITLSPPGRVTPFKLNKYNTEVKQLSKRWVTTGQGRY